MKKHRHRSGIVLLQASIVAGCLLAAACAPPADRSRLAGPSVPPPVERRAPVEYQPAESSGSRPGWLDQVPADRDGLHFQVGMGEYRTTQVEADEAAMQAALVKIGSYVGVQVSQVEEVVRRVSGKESGVLDGTIDTTGKTQLAVNVLIAKAKASQFYRQKFRAMQGKVFQGEAFSSAVLVAVPLEEIRRAREWVEAEKARAEEEKQKILAESARRLEAVDRALAGGEVLRAIDLLQQEWQRLEGVAADFGRRGGAFAGQLAGLAEAQRALPGKTNEVVSALHIDTGRLSPCLLQQTDAQTISVWAWVRYAGGYRPAERLPLVLRQGSGAVLARAVTGKEGQADFSVASNWPSGEIRIVVDTASPALNGFMEQFLFSLSRVEGCLTLTPLPADLEGAVRGAVARLFAGPALAPPRVGKVILGPITYGDSGQGSEFAYLLKKELSRHLTGIPGLEVLSPRTRNAAEVTRALQERKAAAKVEEGAAQVAIAPATRGISLIGASATQAVIDGADAALETVYAVRGGDVVMDLSLRQAASDVLLRSASVGVRREKLPAGVELIPRLEDGPGQAPAAAGGAIRLEVASHLGDGQTYAEGDTISYFVNLDRDAYLLLVYEDAERHLIRILPNRHSGDGFYRADSTLQIPGARDPFEFTITAPFGRERVWAFAASSPFPSLAGTELDNGLVLLEGSLNQVLERVRAVARRPGVAYGEAQTMITTVSGGTGLTARR